MMRLKTSRLILDPITDADIPELHRIYQDERAMRFMPTRPHRTIDETQYLLNQEIGHDGSHHWVVRLDNYVIGIIHFLGATTYPGMGYIFHPDFWGQGYATEACQAVLDYGFNHIGYDRMELWTNEDNLASQMVAKKLGFKLKGRIPQRYEHESQQHIMLVFGRWAHDAHDTKHEDIVFYKADPVLMVHDVREVANYYREKLGFRLNFLYGDPPIHAGVSKADWTGTGVSIEFSKISGEQAIMPSSYLRILMDVNIDKLYADYVANGVVVRSEPQDYPWGFREFSIKDVAGHILVFSTHL